MNLSVLFIDSSMHSTGAKHVVVLEMSNIESHRDRKKNNYAVERWLSAEALEALNLLRVLKRKTFGSQQFPGEKLFADYLIAVLW